MAYPVQDWQAEAVADYADYVELAMINKPRLGYSLGKRGYPDISALANKYIIAARGQFYQSKRWPRDEYYTSAIPFTSFISK